MRHAHVHPPQRVSTDSFCLGIHVQRRRAVLRPPLPRMATGLLLAASSGTPALPSQTLWRGSTRGVLSRSTSAGPCHVVGRGLLLQAASKRSASSAGGVHDDLTPEEEQQLAAFFSFLQSSAGDDDSGSGSGTAGAGNAFMGSRKAERALDDFVRGRVERRIAEYGPELFDSEAEALEWHARENLGVSADELIATLAQKTGAHPALLKVQIASTIVHKHAAVTACLMAAQQEEDAQIIPPPWKAAGAAKKPKKEGKQRGKGFGADAAAGGGGAGKAAASKRAGQSSTGNSSSRSPSTRKAKVAKASAAPSGDGGSSGEGLDDDGLTPEEEQQLAAFFSFLESSARNGDDSDSGTAGAAGGEERLPKELADAVRDVDAFRRSNRWREAPEELTRSALEHRIATFGTELRPEEAAALEWHARVNMGMSVDELMATFTWNGGTDPAEMKVHLAAQIVQQYRTASASLRAVAGAEWMPPIPPPWEAAAAQTPQKKKGKRSGKGVENDAATAGGGDAGKAATSGRAGRSSTGDSPPLVPSVPGLAPNSEVDAWYAETSQWVAQEQPQMDVSKTAQRAPLGSASRLASLDDLTLVTLEQLHSAGGLAPICFLRLTVVLPAFFAGCAYAVVEDHAGQRVRIAVYGTAARSSAEAQAALPVGARFALRGPFLKRGLDRWLGLRVDEPATLVRLDLLPLAPGRRVLVVGDGDLSFSAALARAHRASLAIAASSSPLGAAAAAAPPPPATITVSSYDSEADLVAKYARAAENIRELFADPLVHVAHDIDATALPATGTSPAFAEPFDLAVWNFPYPAGIVNAPGAVGGDLLGGFFRSVRAVLRPGGEVWVTLAQRQGGSSREAAGHLRSWDVEAIGLRHGLELREVVPFDPSRYSGYEPRREFVDETFPWQEARVHVFAILPPPLPEEEAAPAVAEKQQQQPAAAEPLKREAPSPAERHTLGRMASMAQTQALFPDRTSPKAHNKQSRLITRERLAAFTATSGTARTLDAALAAFEAALTEAGAAQPNGERVVRLLAECYSADDGETVAQFPSFPVRERARSCLTEVLLQCLLAGCEPSAPREPRTALQGAVAALTKSLGGGLPATMDYLLKTAVDERIAATTESPRLSPDLRSLLSDALFVIAQLSSNLDAMLAWVEMAAGMGFEADDARLLRLRAQLNSFQMNRLEGRPAEEMREVADAVVADCDRVLELEKDDLRALWTKAFALRNSSGAEATAPDRLSRMVESTRLYERWLELAEPDSRQRPAGHYHLGWLYVVAANTASGGEGPGGGGWMQSKAVPEHVRAAARLARAEYLKGVMAEEARLPFLQPAGQQSKEFLSFILSGIKAAEPERDEAALQREKEEAERNAAGWKRNEEKRAKRQAELGNREAADEAAPLVTKAAEEAESKRPAERAGFLDRLMSGKEQREANERRGAENRARKQRNREEMARIAALPTRELRRAATEEFEAMLQREAAAAGE